MLFVILLIIGIGISILLGVDEVRYGDVGGFLAFCLTGTIFTILISILLTVIVGGCACADAAIEPVEVKETFELQASGLGETWTDDGYEYICILKDYRIKRIPSNQVEIKTIEENKTPYCEKWVYDYANEGLKFWFFNLNANKYIIYMPESLEVGN